MSKCIRFYNIIQAYQEMAGKPMRLTDHAINISDADLEAMERGLRAFASSLLHEPVEQWPDLHRLADRINSLISGKLP